MGVVFPDIVGVYRECPGNPGEGVPVAVRPTMDRKGDRVRVEFSLSAGLAASIYRYANGHELTLSQTGERLLTQALTIRHEANGTT